MALAQIFCVLFLMSCLTPVYALPENIRIFSRLDPNAITITEVDIIFVYDAELAENFPATKKDWYAGKFMLTRSAATNMDVVNTFIPQGFDATVPPLPERKGAAIRILVFALHDDSATKAFDITGFDNALIEIDPFGIRVSDSK